MIFRHSMTADINTDLLSWNVIIHTYIFVSKYKVNTLQIACMDMNADSQSSWISMQGMRGFIAMTEVANNIISVWFPGHTCWLHHAMDRCGLWIHYTLNTILWLWTALCIIWHRREYSPYYSSVCLETQHIKTQTWRWELPIANGDSGMISKKTHTIYRSTSVRKQVSLWLILWQPWCTIYVWVHKYR